MKISQFLVSNRTYPLIPVLNPRKTHFLALGSNLVLLLSRVEAKHKDPKVFKSRYVGGDLYISS